MLNRKKVFVMLFAGLGSFSLAQAGETEAQSSQLRGYRHGYCDSWVHIRDSYGYPAYACAHFPRSIDAAEAYSFSAAVRSLEARVEALEKEVESLKSKEGKSEAR